jgi:hypothetical protein
MRVKKKHIKFVLVLTVIMMVSCDAIRVVRVTNLSNNTIELKTDFPHKITFEKDSNGYYQEILIDDYFVQSKSRRSIEENKDLQIDTISGEIIIKLQPNQYFDIAGGIGPALIKIQPWDLNYSKLSIYTATDTIVATSRNEIIKLFDNPKTKYIKKIDKNTIGINNKYWKNIVIRE